ncbi:LysM peptidoglycan-binding domain-containing protein [Cohnella panacarvi]|uniref:LysM peptidoglycan-binding domain-containing protein n=1 Tax=Cohnella panacarvi TaxID=400776 RepID=UPI00047EB643|nr:LysM peptidoglycan-binding domain-containing protein [Cohnella panacarvi]
MTEPPNGLRFDIYERVHLPDDVAAIDELEEIELVPHMQVLPREDNVLLSGSLLLSGVYRAQYSDETTQLTHWIPVEITLPLNRVQNVDEIGVEIDNFDVDLLSTRSLNVTGVLALRGLQTSSSQEPIWKDDSFTVVHQARSSYEEDFGRDGLSAAQAADDSADDDDSSQAASSQSDDSLLEFDPERIEEQQAAQPQQPQKPQPVPSFADAANEGSWLSNFKSYADKAKSQEQTRAAQPVQSSDGWGDLSQRRDADPQTSQPAAPSYSALEIPALPADVPAAQPETLPSVSAAPEPEPMKIAINGLPSDASQRIQSGVGLLSQLGDIGARRESDLKRQEAAQSEEKANAASSSGSTGDELEWTRLLSGGENEAQSFRKVRMCIVQRDDTLESIADRYNLQPRVLQTHNKLNEPYLSEGQVLYIP